MISIKQLTYIKEHSKELTVAEMQSDTGLSGNSVRAAIRQHNLEYRRAQPKLNEFVKPAKELRVMLVAQQLCKGAQSLHGLAIELDVHIRTVRRYLTLLASLGVKIQKNNQGRFFMDGCPFCKRDV